MFRKVIFSLAVACIPFVAFGAETPLHSIAVAGEAELLLPPDYATIQLGVVTQAPLVGDALAENSARMSRVIAAIAALDIADKDIRTSTFDIQPRYEPLQPGAYEGDAFRTVVGYYVSNKVTVTVRDLTNVAKIIDDSVKAGANASGNVSFKINDVSAHLDDARRRAVENAHHKAQILADAAHIHLGPAISVTDNEANTSYGGDTAGTIETVVVTGSRIPTPIEPGSVSVKATVTVVYSTR
jgi:uncharacterized protein